MLHGTGDLTPIGIEPTQSHGHEGIEPSAPTAQVQYQLTELAQHLQYFIDEKLTISPCMYSTVVQHHIISVSYYISTTFGPMYYKAFYGTTVLMALTSLKLYITPLQSLLNKYVQ